jgi:hypothetical protein
MSIHRLEMSELTTNRNKHIFQRTVSNKETAAIGCSNTFIRIHSQGKQPVCPQQKLQEKNG